MKIFVVNNFASILDGRKSKDRYMFVAEALAERGHDVTYIQSDFNHEVKNYITGDPSLYNFKIVSLHVPGYGDNISFKRLWSHYVWGGKVRLYLNSHEKPDVIFCHIPSMTAAVKCASYCKKNNVNCRI